MDVLMSLLIMETILLLESEEITKFCMRSAKMGVGFATRATIMSAAWMPAVIPAMVCADSIYANTGQSLYLSGHSGPIIWARIVSQLKPSIQNEPTSRSGLKIFID